MIRTMARGYVCIFAVVLVAPTLIIGCGTEKAGGDGTAINCPGGQIYSPNTDKCVDDPSVDGGNVGSSGGASSGGTSSGGTSSGGTSSGGTDTGGELPWALDDSGGLAKDTSAPFDAWWDCPPEKMNPKGKLHGEKCEKHEDCLYGRCFVGGPLTAYNNAIKFCTKNNGCASGNLTPCVEDNGNGKFFHSAFELSKTYPNPKRDPSKDVHKMCARGCKSDSDCTKVNPELPHCLKATKKYIAVGTNPFCGVDPDK